MTSETGISGRRGARAGFTLIEMLVLIIIMAIVAGMASANYARQDSKARFEQSIEDCVALLTAARESAVVSGTDVVVSIDQQTDTWTAAPDDVSTAVSEGVADQSDVPVAMSEDSSLGAEVLTPQPLTLPEDVLIESVHVGQQNDASQTGLRLTGGATQQMPQLRFYEDGSSDGARITLLGADGYQTTLEVSPLTGRVSLAPDEAEASGVGVGRRR